MNTRATAAQGGNGSTMSRSPRVGKRHKRVTCAVLRFRRTVNPGDMRIVRNMLKSSGYFTVDEIKMAVDLVKERLGKGRASGYYFIFAEMGRDVVGYSCYGPVMGTIGSFDLYWISVRENLRGSGIGKRILDATERRVRRMGGERLWVDTSSLDQYAPTRSFYRCAGYRQEAALENFYGPANHKLIFLKVFG